ncbi:MAG: recombinase RecT [Longispora sp.]|nr:recombinase RecT [Longispora sp. (in: high G+C Gram-positive bacteria)]
MNRRTPTPTSDPAAALAERRESTIDKGTPLSELRAKLYEMKDEYALAVPMGYDASTFADQLVRDMITAMNRDHKLMECQPRTLFGALMTMAQLGFRPNIDGQAYIVPYGKTATFVLGYKGLITLAMRSNLVQSLDAATVYENEAVDQQRWDYGRDRHGLYVLHRPILDDSRRGTPVLYFAQAVLKSGGMVMPRPWTVAKMEAFKQRWVRNPGGPWNGTPGEVEKMRWKTVLKELGNYIPRSPDLTDALASDGGVRHDTTVGHRPGEVTEPAPTDAITSSSFTVPESNPDGDTPDPWDWEDGVAVPPAERL